MKTEATIQRRLLETMPPRAIDFRPRLARAIDALSALREGEGAEVFEEIAMRAREWVRAG